RSVAREIGPYLRGAFGGLAGRRTHASQHLLFGPTDHRGLRVGSEAGALGFACPKRKARKESGGGGTSHYSGLSIIWRRDLVARLPFCMVAAAAPRGAKTTSCANCGHYPHSITSSARAICRQK